MKQTSKKLAEQKAARGNTKRSTQYQYIPKINPFPKFDW
jgi:hypothetical protein